MGRLGVLVARHLAEKGTRHLVLVGHNAQDSPDPESERGRMLAALVGSGAIVDRIAADVADSPAALDAALTAAASRTGRVDLVIHAAGVTHDEAIAPIVDTDASAIDRILAPKVAGTRSLWEAAARHDVGRFLLFSSSSAILGGVGLAAYAAANAYLDAFAWWRAQQGDDRWTSVNFHAWNRGDGVAELSGAGDARGGLDPAEALTLIERLLMEAPQPQVLLIPRAAMNHDAAPTEDIVATDAGEAVPKEPPRSGGIRTNDSPVPGPASTVVGLGVEELVTSVWRAVLGDRHDPRNQSFLDLGGDSLAATRAATLLREQLGVHIPLRLVLKAESTAELAAALVRLTAEPAGPSGAGMPPDDRGSARPLA